MTVGKGGCDLRCEMDTSGRIVTRVDLMRKIVLPDDDTSLVVVCTDSFSCLERPFAGFGVRGLGTRTLINRSIITSTKVTLLMDMLGKFGLLRHVVPSLVDVSLFIVGRSRVQKVIYGVTFSVRGLMLRHLHHAILIEYQPIYSKMTFTPHLCL